MDVRCPVCGEANPERAKFCLECGTALAGAAEGASRESRRVVTVVFADMVGFTSLGERLDQESLRRVMDRFYGEMRGAIEGQGGTLAKFIGDAVLAVWGTPHVREDDALRAVRAAEAMRHSLATLNSDLEVRWGVHVGMRTGVNTGEVVVDPSRPADLLVGDTVNVAARLEQAAADGEVLVGADTFHLVRDEAVLEPVEPLALKGKARPMPAWRLVDGLRGDRRAAPRLQAPLVGRDDELARLRATFALVTERRSCQMVTVIGSPGLGKTRLVSEFAASLEGQATVLLGRCEATGEGITFQPVAEVLRMAAGIGDEDAPDVAGEKLATVLLADEPQRERIVDRTAALLGLAPVASPEETFWAVRRLLESLARRRPVVLVHDDIHWGQPTFLDLLEHLVTWVRDAPLLIVGLARPELREVRPALAEPGPMVADVLALEPLAPDASRTLADRLLGDAELPAGLAERVLETTEGNPLFLGEMLRMLADEGVLRREGDRWIAAGDSAGIAVPPTIQALLSARIERLADEERSVVERAAVIGHQFYRGAVAELAPPPVRPKVDMALDTLRRKDLVRPEDFLWLDEQVFRFHHVLIRDAAYRSLLKESRADLHERFADWLEVKSGEVAGEHEEIVAFHLEQAYAYLLELGSLDDHGRAIAERATARLHSAGRRALAREDLPAAINLLRRALAPVPAADPRRAEVLVDLAEALLSAGDTTAAEPVVEQIGLDADEHEDERLGAWATVFVGQLDNLTGAGDVRETLEAVTSAAEVLARAGDHPGEAKAHQVVAQSHGFMGHVAAAEAALDRALVAARAADDRRRITTVLSGAPRAALWGPAPIVRASGRCLDVVRILRMTPGNRHVEAAALRCQAVLEAMRGRPDAARGILDTCRMTFEELGLTFELHETDSHAAIVELLAGEPVAAGERLRAAQEGFQALGAYVFAAQAAALLARALLEQGRDDEAFEATRFAEEHGGEDLKTTIVWLGVRAEVLARRGEAHEALILARRCTELAEPTDALADKADALMALAAVELAAGNEEAARSAASRARDLYAAKDHAVGVTRAEALAGGGPTVKAAMAEPGGEPEWTPRTAAEHVHARWNEAFNARDWTAMEALYPPDHRTVSRRALADDDVEGRDAALALMRSVAEAGQGITVRFRLVAASDEVIAGVQLWHGITESGSPGELEQGLVSVNLDGQIHYAETFDGDDEVGLLGRFEALRAEHAVAPVARAAGRWAAAFNADDGDALLASFADDFEQVDHRAVGWGTQDRTQLTDAMMGWRQLSPDAQCAYRETIAAVDDVFAGISHGLATSPDGGTVTLVVGHVAKFHDGRIAGSDMYEPDDVAAMLARVEELRGGGLGGHDRLILDAHAQRDWSRLPEAYTADYTCRDHRGLGWDITSRDDVLAQHRAVLEIDPDYAVDATRLRAAPAVESVLYSFHGPEKEWEVAFVSVRRIEDGAIALDNFFDPDDEAAIDDCFERLQSPGPGSAGEAEFLPFHRAIFDAWSEAFSTQDGERLGRIYAPDIVDRDHRPGIRGDHYGRDAVVALLQSAAAFDAVTLGWEPLAIVSPRIVAARLTLTGAGAHDVEFEAIFDQVLALDEAGRCVVCDRYEPEQRDEMLTRLQELEREGAPPPLVERTAQRFAEAFNAREWEALDALYAPDIALVDHRSMFSVNDRQDAGGLAELVRSVADLAPDSRWHDELLAARGDRHRLGRFTVSGHEQSGGEWEIAGLLVMEVDEQGRNAHSEIFELDDEAAARARLDQLAGPHALTLGPLAEPGVVTDGAARWAAAHNAHDIDAIAGILAEDYNYEDRRPLIAHSGDRAATIESWRMMHGEIPDLRYELLVLAVSGEVGLAHERWSDSQGSYVIEIETVSRWDDSGRLRAAWVHEPGDPAAWEHYHELTAGPVVPLAEQSQRRYVAAFNARDWEAIEAILPEDLVQVDRRVLGSEVGQGREAAMATLHSSVDVAPDLVLESRTLAVSDDAIAAVLIFRGTTPDGGPAEVSMGYVGVLRDGLVAHNEYLEPDDEEAILARFHALSPTVEATATTEMLGRWVAAVDAHDLDAVEAVFGEDLHLCDHRPGMRHTIEGREAAAETFRATMGDFPDMRVDVEVLRAFDAAALARVTYSSRFGGYEIVQDQVLTTRDGLARSADVFEVDDPAAAELYEAWTAHLRQARSFADLVNAKEWDRLREAYDDSFSQTDYRELGAAAIVGGRAFVDHLEETFAPVADLQAGLDVIAVDGHRRVGRIIYRGHNDEIEGAEFEVVFWTVTTIDGDLRLLQSDLYGSEEDARAALAAGRAPAAGG